MPNIRRGLRPRLLLILENPRGPVDLEDGVDEHLSLDISELKSSIKDVGKPRRDLVRTLEISFRDLQRVEGQTLFANLVLAWATVPKKGVFESFNFEALPIVEDNRRNAR